MDVSDYLHAKGAATEAALETVFARWTDAPAPLIEAMRHSLFAGGKRLRPALVLGACEMVGYDAAPAMPAACAIEMIHTYSLIHDDLPAMDDDDLRRGRPTCHKAYGEATAILAGDALLTMAFDVAAEAGRADVVAEIARAAGVEGMVGGQQFDLAAEGRDVSLDELQRIHRAKTGALIRVSTRCGALLGGTNPTQLNALSRYGEHLGLAFQIADDILDVVGDAKALGKSTGGDAQHHKSTYPALLGLDRARERAEDAVTAAVAALGNFGEEAEPFRALARFVVTRDR